MPDAELRKAAEDLGIKKINIDQRQELVYNILDQQAINKAAEDAQKPVKPRRGRRPNAEKAAEDATRTDEKPAPKKRGRKKNQRLRLHKPPKQRTVPPRPRLNLQHKLRSSPTSKHPMPRPKRHNPSPLTPPKPGPKNPRNNPRNKTTPTTHSKKKQTTHLPPSSLNSAEDAHSLRARNANARPMNNDASRCRSRRRNHNNSTAVPY